MAKGRQGTLLVGTSGWLYAHWAQGVFYPKGLRQGEWLGYFAEHFRTAEVNMSFYRLPPEGMVDRWRDAVPEGFVFALKMRRRVTDVYVYFNNDIEGHAVRNAQRLLELAGTGPPPPRG